MEIEYTDDKDLNQVLILIDGSPDYADVMYQSLYPTKNKIDPENPHVYYYDNVMVHRGELQETVVMGSEIYRSYGFYFTRIPLNTRDPLGEDTWLYYLDLDVINVGEDDPGLWGGWGL